MTKDEAIECAKNMTYQEAIRNTIYAKGIRYKKATRIKLHELAEIADKIDTAEPSGIGRYENAMQKLREMPKYLNGVKAKQIKKISADRPKGEDWDKYSEKLWRLAYERGKNDRPKGDTETEPAPVVAYICDRRRCAICRGKDGGCDHTTDIKHAAHFKNVAGQYFERPYMEGDDDGNL